MAHSDSAMVVTRDNLAETIDAALMQARAGQQGLRETAHASLTRQYIDLAVSTLETLKAQLRLPPSQRAARPTHFGAALVRAEPDLDASLVSLIMKIEDVYRRWHHQIHAR